MVSGLKNTFLKDVFSSSEKVNTAQVCLDMLVSAATAAVELGPDGTGRVGTAPSCDLHGVISIAVDNCSVFQTLDTKVCTGN